VAMGAGLACVSEDGCAGQKCSDCKSDLQDLALQCPIMPDTAHKWDKTVLQNLALLRAAAEGDVVAICDALAAGADVETRRQPLIRPQDPHVQEWGSGSLEQPPLDDEIDLDEYMAAGAASSSAPAVVSDCLPGVRRQGLTPLMAASKEGHLEAMLFLLRSKACLESEDEDGMRPLHFAALAGAHDCCQALLQARACPTALDDLGRDAYACLPRECTLSRLERSKWRKLMHPVSNDGENLAPSNLSRPQRDLCKTPAWTAQDYQDSNIL